MHLAVDTLGRLHALHATPANGQDREQVSALAQQVQEVTSEAVELVLADQGYTGDQAQEQAEKQGITLMVVKHTAAKKGFVLLPRHWGVERSFCWVAGIRQLASDYERLAESLKGMHVAAFVCLMLGKLVAMLAQIHNRR